MQQRPPEPGQRTSNTPDGAQRSGLRPVPERPSIGVGGRFTGSLRYLLDLDPELADSLDVSMRLGARRLATAVVFEAETGDLDLVGRFAQIGHGPGLLVLGGVLVLNVTVGGRVASELLGTGDLLESDTSDADELFTCSTSWRCLMPSRFAVLDEAFGERIARWPELSHVLLVRAERRTYSLNVQRAIASQPRLEIRLALLLAHLASRWGRVEPGGLRLTLPLTHQLLGRLVGAERPSVSHALARLHRSGLVSGTGDEWHLHTCVDEHFDAMLDDVPAGGPSGDRAPARSAG
jgi:CRP-like cAMP-binding protein